MAQIISMYFLFVTSPTSLYRSHGNVLDVKKDAARYLVQLVWAEQAVKTHPVVKRDQKEETKAAAAEINLWNN